jgi:hypothetical protein
LSAGTVATMGWRSLDVVTVHGISLTRRSIRLQKGRQGYDIDSVPSELSHSVVDPPGDMRCGYWSLLCTFLNKCNDTDAQKVSLAYLLAFKSALARRIVNITLEAGGHWTEGEPWHDLAYGVLSWFLESGVALENMIAKDPVWMNLYGRLQNGLAQLSQRTGGVADIYAWIQMVEFKGELTALVLLGIQCIVHACLDVDVGFAIDNAILEHSQFNQMTHMFVAMCGCFEQVALVLCNHYVGEGDSHIGHHFGHPTVYAYSASCSGLPSCVLINTQRTHTHQHGAVGGRHYIYVLQRDVNVMCTGAIGSAPMFQLGKFERIFQVHTEDVNKWRSAQQQHQRDMPWKCECGHETDISSCPICTRPRPGASSTSASAAGSGADDSELQQAIKLSLQPVATSSGAAGAIESLGVADADTHVQLTKALALSMMDVDATLGSEEDASSGPAQGSLATAPVASASLPAVNAFSSGEMTAPQDSAASVNPAFPVFPPVVCGDAPRPVDGDGSANFFEGPSVSFTSSAGLNARVAGAFNEQAGSSGSRYQASLNAGVVLSKAHATVSGFGDAPVGAGGAPAGTGSDPSVGSMALGRDLHEESDDDDGLHGFEASDEEPYVH